MIRELLPFPAAPTRAKPKPKIDLTWSTQTLLQKLAARLPQAIQFRDRVVKRGQRWNEPKLFFFDEPPVKQYVKFADTPAAMATARENPDLALAWSQVTDFTEDVFTLLASSVDLRHLARTDSELASKLSLLGGHHPQCKALTDLLAITDDEVVCVLFPRQRAGFRVSVSGIADVAQFHILLADAIHGDPRRGYLVGARPDPRLVDACRFEPVDSERDTATAVFQFYRPEALRADGTLPDGFQGKDDWVWGHERLDTLPIVNRERLLLADTAVYSRQWVVGRKFAAVEGSLDLIEVMAAEQVMEQMSLRRDPQRVAA